MDKQTVLLVGLGNLPTDDLLGLCPDKMFLVGRQNAEGELLPSASLPIHHICALVHVDGALREGGRLQVQNKSFKRGSVMFHSHQHPSVLGPQVPLPWWGRPSWMFLEDA